MVTTSKKNTAILKKTISSRRKRILQILFSLVETIIEIRKTQIFKKQPSSCQWKFGGIQFLKSNVILELSFCLWKALLKLGGI